jgi:hypothetical protein
MRGTGTAPQRQYRFITVNITPGNPPTVDVDPTRVSKKRQDALCWRCEGDPNWEVNYGSDSPFRDSVFNASNCCSGPPVHHAKESPHQYKYTVRAGGGTLDPGTVVDP